MVDHVILARKLFHLQVPIFIIQWIMLSFLTNRTQTTKLGFQASTQLPINRSIVQGSGIGPNLFMMFIHDLKPKDVLNYLLKYADDVSLLCPQNSGTPIELEMAHYLRAVGRKVLWSSACVCLSVCLCVCAHCVCPQDISRTGSWITTKFGGGSRG